MRHRVRVQRSATCSSLPVQGGAEDQQRAGGDEQQAAPAVDFDAEELLAVDVAIQQA